MPLPAYSSIDPFHLSVLARSKAARECNRPERDLRLLLAHVRILDVLEHSDVELSDSSEDERDQQPCSRDKHGTEHRPCQPRHGSKSAEEDDLADLFESKYDGQPKIAVTATTVSVQEVSDED